MNIVTEHLLFFIFIMLSFQMNKSKNTLQVNNCVCDPVMIILVINWLHLELSKTWEMDIPMRRFFPP